MLVPKNSKTLMPLSCLSCSVSPARDTSDIMNKIWVYVEDLGIHCNASACVFSDLSLWLTPHLRSLSQKCSCSQLSSSWVERGLLPERGADRLRRCLPVSLLWTQQDWAVTAVNWCRSLQPGLNLLPLCPQ